MQRHDGEAVIKVLAEAAGGDLVREVAVGGGDDAHIDLHPAAADTLERLLLQGAHDLALRLERHVGDLVEEEGAAMRLLERADLARAVGIGVGLGAEQLDLEPVGPHRGAAQDHERALGAARALMDEPRRDFLADARPRR